MPSYAVAIVSWPLAGPFPAKCATSVCLKIGVRSTPSLCHYTHSAPHVSDSPAKCRSSGHTERSLFTLFDRRSRGGSETTLLFDGKFHIACERQPKTIAPLAIDL